MAQRKVSHFLQLWWLSWCSFRNNSGGIFWNVSSSSCFSLCSICINVIEKSHENIVLPIFLYPNRWWIFPFFSSSRLTEIMSSGLNFTTTTKQFLWRENFARRSLFIDDLKNEIFFWITSEFSYSGNFFPFTPCQKTKVTILRNLACLLINEIHKIKPRMYSLTLKASCS